MSPRIIQNFPVDVDYDDASLRLAVAKELGVVPESLGTLRVIRRSLDARSKRRGVHYVLNIEIFKKEDVAPALWSGPDFGAKFQMPDHERPLIVGSGPAGLFAALRLLEYGIAPILIERGKPIYERSRQTADFRHRGIFDANSNYCYGEGGAGTFSDGKLYTRKKHPLVRTVLEWLVAYGADEFETLVNARPHIGTNRLIPITVAIREALQDTGVDIRFDTRMESLRMGSSTQSRAVEGVQIASGEVIPSPNIILATGHSARELYEHLHTEGVPMESKSMAIGFRVEHPQSMVNARQLGTYAKHPRIGAAAYQLAHNRDGRGVYTFCMCPGGHVIPTPAAPGRLNVNGMSHSSRRSPFANSAVVVTVDPRDYLKATGEDPSPISGLRFQDQLEKSCFVAGGSDYRAPAQTIPDFLAGKCGNIPDDTSYRPGLLAYDLSTIVPAHLVVPMRQALRQFGKSLHGFDSQHALAIGLETTTSSPVRILRDAQTMMSPGAEGLYPCGEGAGFAGGIVSSAIDGIRVADALAQKLGAQRQTP